MPAIHWDQIHLYWTVIHQFTRLGIPESDGRSRHNRGTDSGSDGGRSLGSMPATQRYRIHHPATFIHESTVLNGVLAIPGLDDRFLHNCGTDPGSDYGTLLGSTPATQRYKVRLCRIKTQELAVLCEGGIKYPAGDILLDGGLLHNRSTDFDSVCGRLLGLTPAFQWYKVRLCRIKGQEVAVFRRENLYSSPGDILLDIGLLHSRVTDFDALCGRLLGSRPATQPYKVRLCRIDTQELADPCVSGLYNVGTLAIPELDG